MISVHGLITKPGRDQLISYLDMDIHFFMEKHINCYFLKLQMNCSYYTSGRPDFTNRTEISEQVCVKVVANYVINDQRLCLTGRSLIQGV